MERFEQLNTLLQSGNLTALRQALAGMNEVDIADFMQDFIYGFATSEFFTFFAVALLNLIAAVVCSLVTPQRTGYTRGK